MTEAEWLASEDPAAMLELARSNVWPVPHGWRGVSERKLRLFCAACASLEFGRRSASYANWGKDGRADPGEPGGAPLADAQAWCRREPYGSDGIQPSDMTALLREIAGDPWRRVTFPRGRSWMECHNCGPIRPPMPPPVVTVRDLLECGKCGGTVIHDRREPSPWRTPQVIDLAAAAYRERWDWCPCFYAGKPDGRCQRCRGQAGRGFLEPARLAVLADALEEAGCPAAECHTCKGAGTVTQEHPFGDTWVTETLACPHCEGVGIVPHPLVRHLRSPGPHVRGCWALDLVLGRE